MKLFSSTAIVLAAGLCAAPAAAQYNTPSSAPQQSAGQPAAAAQAQPQIKLSSKAGKAIMDLQTAVNANDTANIPAKLAAANAVATSKDDHYAIGQLQLKAAINAKDNVAALAAADTIAASGFVGPDRVGEIYNAVGVSLYNAKQYDQASAAFQKAAAVNPNSPEPLKLQAESLNAQGKRAEAAGVLSRALQLSTAAGRKPEETLYKRAVGMAYEAKSPTAITLGREWVAAYPTPDSWHNALAIYRNMNNPDPALALDILRLSRATKSMQGVGDYHIYAYEAANQANYGEAKALMAEGLASGQIKASDPVVQEIQGILKGKASPTAAELAAREGTAKIPTAYLKVGDAYYGAGNYQKAAALYAKAVASGADANLTNLRLGEALAMAGDKAGATAALSKVSGAQAEIAKFWLLYVQHG